MLLQHLLLDACQADAGNARGHAGEILGHQGAGQADGFEVRAAAIGADHGDAHLRHDLQQALVHRLGEALQAIVEREIAEQPAAMAVGDGRFRQIGIHRGGADADQHRGMMHIQAFAGAHIERGEGAQLLAQQMRMHRACREDHRYRGAGRAALLVGQDDMHRAAAHGVLRLAPHPGDGVAQRVVAGLGAGLRNVVGAVDLNGRGAHIGAHGLELRRQQDRRLRVAAAGTGFRPGRGCCRDCRGGSSGSSRGARAENRSAGW